MEPSYLGANPIWAFVTGNNALPRTHGLRQPVHKDITFFHPQVLTPRSFRSNRSLTSHVSVPLFCYR
jgi:hypothetical protein